MVDVDRIVTGCIVVSFLPIHQNPTQPGNCLWATDQIIGGTANTCCTFYPANDGWDIIWPAGHLLTLRCVTGTSALGRQLYVVAWVKCVGLNPAKPQPPYAFCPSLMTL